MSALCRIAFCADMNSNLVQYEQRRHWTEQVIKIHQTSYWSSLPRGFGKLNPNPHFRILLPCQWVPVFAASHLIPLQSEYLFTLWQRVAEMNSICDELLYYVNGSPTMVVCMRDWSTVLPVFQGSFPKYTQAYLSTAVFLLKNIFTTVSFWFKSNYTKFSVILRFWFIPVDCIQIDSFSSENLHAPSKIARVINLVYLWRQRNNSFVTDDV